MFLRRILLVGMCAAAIVPVLTPAATAGPVVAQKVVTGARFPAGFAVAPDGKIYYAEFQGGVFKVYDPKTKTSSVYFSAPQKAQRKAALSVALHPNFPATPQVFLYGSRMVNGVARNHVYRVTGVTRGSAFRVIHDQGPTGEHNGGRLVFGPDKMLYVTMGDLNQHAAVQDLSQPLGKVHRMTTTGAPAAGNPYPGSTVWAYGFRNPFGGDFDPRSGRLWLTENGPECNDEINAVGKGKNYGWGPKNTCGNPPKIGDTNSNGPSPTLPVHSYSATIGPTGAAFCVTCRIGPLNDGRLHFGATNTGQIRRLTLNSGRTAVVADELTYQHTSVILGVETGPDGSLWFSDDTGIYRLALS